MAVSVPSVVQAFAILRVLADGRALTLSEIAQACAISPSSCFSLLRTLLGEGVLRAGEGKRYTLAPPWSGIVADEPDAAAHLIARARPLLARVARAWQAPVGLWRTIGRDRLQLVALGESDAATRIHMEEGQRQPIGGGSVGRALAAVQGVSRDEMIRRFAALRWQRAVTQDEYVAQIAQAAARGYAVDDGLTHAGVASLAVAVPGTPPMFGISASVFAGSRSDADLAALAAALRTLADDIAASPDQTIRKARA